MGALAGKVQGAREEQILEDRYKANILLVEPFKDLEYELEKHHFVGATSLASRFLTQTWPTDVPPTPNFKRTIYLDDRLVSVSVDDGDEGRGIITVHAILADLLRASTVMGVVVLYDVTRRQTWEDCKMLIEGLEHRAKELLKFYVKPPKSIREKLMIVGCKCDLVQEREVDSVIVKQYADEKGLLFCETSAKEDINVEFALVSFVAQLL